MPTMKTLDPTYQFYMFKGEPGTRKSTAALSFPTPQYWFDWDLKMQSMLVPMYKWGINPEDVVYDNYMDWDKARKKLEEFTTKCKHPDGRKYETIVIDSFTSGMDMTLRQTLSFKGGQVRKSGQAAGKTIANIPINEIEDYNAESSAANEMIALLKDIATFHKLNVIIIAHVMEVTFKGLNGETSMSRTIVTAGKRVAAKLPGYCSEVYHFDIEKSLSSSVPGDYTCITENTGEDFARTGLELPRRIKFNEKPLYKDFLAPAIAKLKAQNVQVIQP
jgi:AAA domain